MGAALDEFLPDQLAGAQQTVLDILSHAAQAEFEAVVAPDSHAGIGSIDWHKDKPLGDFIVHS